MTVFVRERIMTMFSDLEFDEQRHIYYWDGERIKKSVTKLVEQFVPEFDEAKWLPVCALKEGISEHELKHKWQTINKEACELGTETHDYLEHYNGVKTPQTPQQKAGVKFLSDYLQDYEIVVKEARMYSRKYKFAGTADLILRHKITGKLVIADYKTNKDIFKTYGMMEKPFSSLESHPYNHYQIQLSYYQLMLNEIGVEISDRIIVYLKADETYQVYNTWDFTADLTEHLNNNAL